MKPNKAAEEARPRLGRGLAALLGGAEASPQAATAPPRAEKNTDRISAPQSAQSPPAICRRRTRRARRVHQGKRHYPAASRPPRAGHCGHLSKSSRASAAGAPRSAPACMSCRSSPSRPTTVRRSNSRSSKMSSAAISTRSRKRRAMSSSSTNSTIQQTDLAKVIGKSRSHVANSLRLLKLPERAKTPAARGKTLGGSCAAAAAPRPSPIRSRTK